MKLLAFDIEIARDLNKIPFREFKPAPWEKVEAYWESKGEWVLVNYEEKYDRFLDAMGGIIEAEFWRPLKTDWKRFRPLGITCAAAASSDGHLWNWWAHDRGKFTAQMTKDQCFQLALELAVLVDDGYTLLTWNGLSFDFDILAEEAGEYDLCKSLAMTHADLMFQFFCTKGYPLGLDTACKGMGLPGKPEDMDGALAPVKWEAGEYHKVLDYVSWDVKNTLALAGTVVKTGAINWISRSGRSNQCEFPQLMTAREALELPEPDTSWMSDPMARWQFYEWTKNEK